jgi:hypothetical protein
MGRLKAAMKQLAFLLTSAVLMTVTAISSSFAQDKVGIGTGTQGFSSISPGNYSEGNYGPGNYGLFRPGFLWPA